MASKNKKTNIQSPENYDRFIDDKERRSKGQFYTPKLFADYAHKMISEVLGNNWKDEYVVWDNCCGTKNLTRDYKFKELYCSTLEKAELDISAQFNPEAESFVFDFLNEPIAGRESLTGVYDDKLPKGLKDALLENKPIVFLLNPPYSCNGNMFGEGKGNNQTSVYSIMTKNKINGRNELHNQFLYRIILLKQHFNLTNCHIALFCKPSFLTKPSYNKFREEFLKNFKYDIGILFNAGNFAQVSAKWGISFNIWSSGEQQDKNNFVHTLVKVDDGEIKKAGEKILYNLDNKKGLMEWVYNGKQEKRTILFPSFKSRPIDLFEGKTGKITSDTISVIYDSMNGVGSSNVFYVGNGGGRFPITKSNFEKAVQAYFIKTASPSGWEYDKDELSSPSMQNNIFTNDCIVYTLFGCANISLRNVNYHDKLWDIKNEFFWMSKSEIESLALKYDNDYCYKDAHSSSERFVYEKLQTITLSPEANAVLDKANDIVRKTFKYRKQFDKEHPEYQIMNFDCGWYQIKKLCKEYMPELLKEFKEVYKVLADKMRPMVYTLGFLK